MEVTRGLRFRSGLDFFGLPPDYMKDVYEQFFFLKQQGGWSFTEAYNLPIKIRTWFVRRLIRQIEEENEQLEKEINKAKNQRG